MTWLRLTASALCIGLAACEREGAVDPAAVVLEFTATPPSIQSGQSVQLAWSSNGNVVSVKITAGDCPERAVPANGVVGNWPPCPGEVAVTAAAPRKGVMVVTPAASTTYWCFPDRIREAGFVFGRAVRVEVNP